MALQQNHEHSCLLLKPDPTVGNIVNTYVLWVCLFVRRYRFGIVISESTWQFSDATALLVRLPMTGSVLRCGGLHMNCTFFGHASNLWPKCSGSVCYVLVLWKARPADSYPGTVLEHVSPCVSFLRGYQINQQGVESYEDLKKGPFMERYDSIMYRTSLTNMMSKLCNDFAVIL